MKCWRLKNRIVGLWLAPIYFAFVALPVLFAADVQQLKSRFDNAFAQIRSGNFIDGCTEAKRLSREAPRYAASYNLLGVCAVHDGDRHQAESYFRTSISFDPGFVEARINLGLTLFQQQKTAAAVVQLREALRLDPKNVTALYRLGQAEFTLGSKSDAVMHLGQANQLAPQSSDIALSLITALFAAGEAPRANTILQTIIHDQGDIGVIISASLIATKAGEQLIARQGLDKALSLSVTAQATVLDLAREAAARRDYNLTRTLLTATQNYQENLSEWNALLGYAMYQLGDPGDALTYLRRAIELDPTIEDYYIKIGELLLRYGSDEAAIDFFNAGLARLPNSALLYFGLAVSYWSHARNLQLAAENLDKALRLDPEFEPALSLLCELHYRQHEWRELQDTARRLIQQKLGASTGYYYEAVALFDGDVAQSRDERIRESRDLLERSLKLRPDFADAHIAMGKLLLETGQVDQSIREFERVIKLRPDEATGYYHLAMAYRRAGDKERAAQLIDKFKALRNGHSEHDGYLVLFSVVK